MHSRPWSITLEMGGARANQLKLMLKGDMSEICPRSRLSPDIQVASLEVHAFNEDMVSGNNLINGNVWMFV